MNEDDKVPPAVTDTGGWLGPAIARAMAGELDDVRENNVIVLADAAFERAKKQRQMDELEIEFGRLYNAEDFGAIN